MTVVRGSHFIRWRSSFRFMISTFISRVSAVVLGLGGLALLFAADAILPRIIPGFPAAAFWLGQLLAAGWLAIALLNWASQPGLLGGIYGRPVVLANNALYFITTMAVLKIAFRAGAPAWLWLVIAPAAALAIVYGWLLFRGPFERDFQMTARAG
jgi:hypothetical protein